jgi:HlyD family secretion protein
MRRRTKIIIGTVIGGGVLVVAGMTMLSGRGGPPSLATTIEVTTGSVVEKAIASGTIEPSAEVEVKSKVSGVVRRLYEEAGSYVKAGTPLLEIRPDPTPQELVDARRQVELREMELATAVRERDRNRSLREAGVVTVEQLEQAERQFEAAQLQETIAREHLALLEGGTVKVGDRALESVVYAPIDGYILERLAKVGEMVIPLGSFQSGTVLFKMADMNDLVFRGTVDEIDVGRLSAGADVAILVGALPEVQMKGRVTRIALRSTRTDQSVGFPVEIEITDRDGAVLRAGYSATAEITVRRADDALLIPERLVTYAGDTTIVMVQNAAGEAERRVITTGVSDAVNVQVLSGLEAGDRVLDARPVQPAGS